MNKRIALAAPGLATALALVPMTAASAAPKPQVNSGGQGSYAVRADGAAVLTGTTTGAPFDGRFTAVLRAQDGTLPEPGVCEAGTATLRIEGPRGRYVEFASSDDVCGTFVQPPNVVTHVFAGVYDVASSSEKRLRGGDGFLELRLTQDGRASITASDT
jgi:hypothetical protein